jgi:hypothetical protein
MPPPTDAAFDLGLTEEARENFRQRLTLLFREGCAIFGAAKAAKLFREQARKAPKEVRRKVAPPRKRMGGHDPEGDALLLSSWKAGSWKSKIAFAEAALKHHAVKNRGKVQAQAIEPKSLVRRLNRLLKRQAGMRQIGKRKAKP